MHGLVSIYDRIRKRNILGKIENTPSKNNIETKKCLNCIRRCDFNVIVPDTNYFQSPLCLSSSPVSSVSLCEALLPSSIRAPVRGLLRFFIALFAFSACRCRKGRISASSFPARHDSQERVSRLSQGSYKKRLSV